MTVSQERIKELHPATLSKEKNDRLCGILYALYSKMDKKFPHFMCYEDVILKLSHDIEMYFFMNPKLKDSEDNEIFNTLSTYFISQFEKGDFNHAEHTGTLTFEPENNVPVVVTSNLAPVVEPVLEVEPKKSILSSLAKKLRRKP